MVQKAEESKGAARRSSVVAVKPSNSDQPDAATGKKKAV
jgi:hypothetical protein